MTTALMIGGNGLSGFPSSSSSSSSSSPWTRFKSRRNNTTTVNGTKFSCSSSSFVMDPYKTLRIRPGASESDVKKAFRQLALQYHPDVCRGSNCGIQFQTINEAYDIVMRQVRGETEAYEAFDGGADEGLNGMNDPDWDMWEEWMGWEGAGILDYSSHINPYI